MTKIYEGNGIHTVHLSSGNILRLSEDEMNEIANENDRIVELEVELADTEALYERTKESLNTTVKQLQDAEDKIESMQDYIDELEL